MMPNKKLTPLELAKRAQSKAYEISSSCWDDEAAHDLRLLSLTLDDLIGTLEVGFFERLLFRVKAMMPGFLLGGGAR